MINFSQYTLSHVEVATGQAFGIHQELFSNNFIEFKHAHQYFDFNPWSFQIWYK